tara:strand:- start:5807 stop:6967 length:1161 start_codon:yes stop_codon:yes gene_type:complete
MEVLHDTYKDTKIGRIPKDWELLSVEKCILKKKFSVGKLPKKDYFKEGRFPIIDQSKTFIIGYSSHSELLYNGNLPAIIYGDHTNHVKYISFPFICGAGGVKIIQPLDELDNKFVYYSILYRKPQSEGYKRHFSILKEKYLCIPPLPEQQKIAAILSTVDEQISATDKIIKKSKELKKGLMQKLFSEGLGHTEFKDTKIGRIPKDWKLVKIGEVTKIKVGRDLKEDSFSEIKTETHKYPVFSNTVSNNGFYGGYYNFAEHIGRSLTIVGRGVGIGTSFSRDGGYGAIGRLLVLFPNDDVNEIFMSNYVNHKMTIHYEDGGIPQLTGDKISKYLVVKPNLNEQIKIAAILSEADAKIEKEQTQKAHLEQLKKGLMQQLLTGKKRVKI